MTNIEFARIILDGAKGSFVPNAIFGPQASDYRQRIMTAMHGKRVPKAQCGYNAVRSALFNYFLPSGDCLAAREDSLQRILEGVAK